MILYHGTNINFKSIDLSKSNRFKDFGQGFYLTDIRTQAERMAVKKADLFGNFPIVKEYSFDESLISNGALRSLIFEEPTEEWAEFVFKNRSRELNFKHNYDIVIGPIADDGVAYLLGRYEEGTLTMKELCDKLTYRKLNNQYFFGTQKSIEYLKEL